MIKTWAGMEKPKPVPWMPLAKPLSECTVALISSAGIALKTDRPFDPAGERQNPWWGDPSYRVLPKMAAEKDVHTDLLTLC
jgi:D-proline reductase (dithiol) PrdB